MSEQPAASASGTVPMRAYLLTLWATRDKHYVSRRTVRAATLVDAERLAVNALRARRLTADDGPRWDAWSLTTSLPGYALPRIVATGSHDGTRWSQRELGWEG